MIELLEFVSGILIIAGFGLLAVAVSFFIAYIVGGATKLGGSEDIRCEHGGPKWNCLECHPEWMDGPEELERRHH